MTAEKILSILTLRGFGPETVRKICDYLVAGCLPIDDRYLFNHIIDYLKIVGNKRIPFPSWEEFQVALDSARNLMHKSDSLGVGVVTRYDDAYPKKLLRTVNEKGHPSAPLMIFYKGNLSVASRPSLAVIGTRNATQQGLIAGEYYASAFASLGVNIVSGLALGCDFAAHTGALQVSGPTTAFLAHGLDIIFPVENQLLAESIIENGGLLMSEYPIGTSVTKYNLVSRDRLQAGLADSIMVIQTPKNGGTMHAVRAAKSVKKRILVVTYSQPQGYADEGNRMLINEGATSFRVKKEEIISNPSKYLEVISYKGENESLTLV